jgi:hypothetical protein
MRYYAGTHNQLQPPLSTARPTLLAAMDDASTLSNTTLLAAELESFLPQLPGYRPRRTQPGPKPQKLGFREGIRVLADEAPGQPDLSDLKSTGGLTSTFNSSSVGAPTVKARGAASRTLVFNGYFKETVQESNLENQRVRKLRITHHLEDSTTSMNELKADNSGLPEGKFLQRHPVVNDETGEVLAPEDLAVGRVVGVYVKSRTLPCCCPARCWCCPPTTPAATTAERVLLHFFHYSYSYDSHCHFY